MTEVTSYTVRELARRGRKDIPATFSTSHHLVYSSPATLAFNSPGAEGFGVKRAGLAVPGSVMLIVSPGCCGRNTSEISSLPAYRDRFFYLEMSQTDLITGAHLRRIPEAVCEVRDFLARQGRVPSVVMICATCVDALLGTDFDRVCRSAEERAGVRVRPCYMYALTREGVHPPMVGVRQSIYSLLEARERDRRAVNLLGFFAPLDGDCELYRYLAACGVRHVREISRCATYEEFLEMGEAGFNVVLDPEARAAAGDLTERLAMPYVELLRLMRPERLHRQYQAFARALGAPIDDAAEFARARAALPGVVERHAHLTCAVGECANGDPFELALALAEAGFEVREVFATVQPGHFPTLDRLAAVSPDTRVYCNQDPSMVAFAAEARPSFTIGADAAYYYPDRPSVPFNGDRQPFGYEAVAKLAGQIEEVLA